MAMIQYFDTTVDDKDEEDDDDNDDRCVQAENLTTIEDTSLPSADVAPILKADATCGNISSRGVRDLGPLSDYRILSREVV